MASSSTGSRQSSSKTSVMVFRTNNLVAMATESRLNSQSGGVAGWANKLKRVNKSIYLAGVGKSVVVNETVRSLALSELHDPMTNARAAARRSIPVVNQYMALHLTPLRPQMDEQTFRATAKSVRADMFMIDRYASVVKITRRPTVQEPWHHDYEEIDPNTKVICAGSGNDVLQNCYNERFGGNHPDVMDIGDCISFLRNCIWYACQRDFGSGGPINIVLLTKDFCLRKTWAQESNNPRYASLPYMEVSLPNDGYEDIDDVDDDEEEDDDYGRLARDLFSKLVVSGSF